MSIDPNNGYHVLMVAAGCVAGTIVLGNAFLRMAARELRNAISPFALWPEGPRTTGKIEA